MIFIMCSNSTMHSHTNFGDTTIYNKKREMVELFDQPLVLFQEKKKKGQEKLSTCS